MAELTVDMTYGNALFQVAREMNCVADMEEELMAIDKVFEETPEFFMVINDPTISAQEKKDILTKVFADKIMKEVLNFFYILVDKGRTRHFQRIVREFQKLRNHQEGFVVGTVYSSWPLEQEQIRELQEKSEKILDRKIKLENKIDSSLIGGVKILADGRMIDASLQKRLGDLGQSLRK